MEFILGGLIKGLKLILELNPEVMGITWVSLRVSLTAIIAAAIPAVPLGVLIAQK